jgi:hypothetical protein
MKPQKPPAVQVMVRMSGNLKAAMDREAAKNQTSISGEVSHRLKRTLTEDAERADPNRRVLQRLIDAWRHGGEIGADARKVDRANWLSDPIAFDVALAELNAEAATIRKLLFEQAKDQPK